MANLVVTTNLDVVNASDGEISLREAIAQANGNVDVDSISFAAALAGQTLAISSQLILTNDVTINGDTNGDGDFDITLTNDPIFASEDMLTVNAGVNATLSSLSLSGAMLANYGNAVMVTNRGNLTLNYVVVADNVSTPPPPQLMQAVSMAPISNTGELTVNQTVFSGNDMTGQQGLIDIINGVNGYSGGSASASIINSGQVGLAGVAFIGGSAQGGDGSSGDNTGGAGGDAAVGLLNFGTFSGSGGFQGSASAIGGAAGTGFYQAAPGQSSTTHLNIYGGTGSMVDVLTGTQFADVKIGTGVVTLFGLGGNDVLSGAAGSSIFGGTGHDIITSSGASTIRGGLGNDSLRTTSVSNTAQGVWDGGGGTDTIDASLSTSAIGLTINLLNGTSNSFGTVTGFENIIGTNASTLQDRLTGDASSNIITSLAGNDILDGGAGADTMTGGTGNDLYYVDSVFDVVIEGAGGGTADRVLTSVNYTLAADQQIELFSTTNSAGTGAINLIGNNLANTILGNNGANFINGGGGVDRMTGLAGNDQYYVDNAHDLVFEGVNGGTADRVFTSVDYTLAANQQIEILSTLNSALTTALNLTGNNLVNNIAGNNGVNIINGGGGIDSMNGLLGNDLYYVDNAADTVLEGVNGGTLDRVLTSVNYTLGANQQIELFSTTNSTLTTAISLTGNNVANRILGNNGANSINGGLANDFLTGGLGADKFVFNTAITGGGNVDTIADFTHLIDDIQLAQSIFTGIGATLDAAELRLGAAASTTSQRIVYDSVTGNLFFDSDGSGATAQVQFAKVTAGTILDISDFIMV